MSKARDIYAEVKAGKTDLGDLTDAELAKLMGHLARKGSVTGAAGRIWGECLVEAATRWMQSNRPARKASGTEALSDFVTTDPDA